VRGAERSGGLPADVYRHRRDDAADPAKVAVEALAVEELHDDVRRPLRLQGPAVEDLDDIGMLNGARRARFVYESREHLLVARQILLQDLDGDAAVDARMLGDIDHAHAALAERAHDAVIPNGASNHVQQTPDARTVTR